MDLPDRRPPYDYVPLMLGGVCLAKEVWEKVQQTELEATQHLDLICEQIAQADSAAAQEISHLRYQLDAAFQAWHAQRQAITEAAFEQQSDEMDMGLKRQMQELADMQKTRAQAVIDELINIVEHGDGDL